MSKKQEINTSSQIEEHVKKSKTYESRDDQLVEKGGNKKYSGELKKSEQQMKKMEF